MVVVARVCSALPALCLKAQQQGAATLVRCCVWPIPVYCMCHRMSNGEPAASDAVYMMYQAGGSICRGGLRSATGRTGCAEHDLTAAQGASCSTRSGG